VVIADEPISALDVSVRAQILRLMFDLQQKKGLAYLFITHDLGVVRAFAQRVAVMYQGRIVEEGTADAVLDAPRHAYTQRLLAATSVPDPRRQRAA
ncbi:MAG: ABC transporter ATP-binding protein, partial [Rhodoferax sp.]|nr:ABC transporter ATP-binding protein [Rhodoferax sp.]